MSVLAADGWSVTPGTCRIFRLENHDEALPVWRACAGTGRVLVHVDAHHDMWRVPAGQRITIANFIGAALRDGIIGEIHWVVPDRSWESAENRHQILRHVRRIQREFPGKAPIKVTGERISTAVLGSRLHICSMEGLPKFDDDVLLDLDVDYMIFPRVSYGVGDPHPALPWCWPEQLLARLAARAVRADVVTIAYSVEGGYTPLRWKYLGDELEARLRQDPEEPQLRAMALMRKAAELAARGDHAAAESCYLEAAEPPGSMVAAMWHLAFFYLERGRTTEAQQMYRRALELDPTYRTVHNCAAIWHYWAGRWEAARRECHRMLALDPSSAYAHAVLGWLASDSAQWPEAEAELLLALKTDPELLDAHRSLGRVYRKQGRWREALGAYETSLKLALSGREPLRENPVVISSENPLFRDTRHFTVFARLGQLWGELGDRDRASRYLRMAAAGGQDGCGLRCRLAWWELCSGRWLLGGRELFRAARQAGVWMGRASARVFQGALKSLADGIDAWRVR